MTRISRVVFPGMIGGICYKAWNGTKPKFLCPICHYHGPFYDVGGEWGSTKHEHCPQCGSNARMRLQYLVLEQLRRKLPAKKMSMLHFAPEKAFSMYFKGIFGQYHSADLANPLADYQVDLRDLPFDDQSYDFVFASHVLEHIDDDQKALSEIRRVLKPHGIAVLPVPIVSVKTIEYEQPNPYECGHVRSPGQDYFERYAQHFSTVEVMSSRDFPEEYQLYSYEDRTLWPTEQMPLREAMAGERHPDYVPICVV